MYNTNTASSIHSPSESMMSASPIFTLQTLRHKMCQVITSSVSASQRRPSQHSNHELPNYTSTLICNIYTHCLVTGLNHSTPGAPVRKTITSLQWSLAIKSFSEGPSVVGFFCCMAPHWLAFLYEGPNPFLAVSESQVVHHHLGGGGVRCVSTLSHLSLEDMEGRWQLLKCFHTMNPASWWKLVWVCI